MRRWSMSEAERWLEQARRDLDDARYAAQGSRVIVSGDLTLTSRLGPR